MIIQETSGYKNSCKKMKKKPEFKEELDKILSHIEAINSFDELKDHPISLLYGFEVLRSDLTGYYKFSITSNNKYRLLFSYNIEYNIIILEYISENHYEDFKKYLKK